MEKKFFKWLLKNYLYRFTKGIWKDTWEYVKEETLYASKPSQTYEAAKILFIIFLVLALAQKLPCWVAVISFGYLIYADIRKKYISGDFRRGEHDTIAKINEDSGDDKRKKETLHADEGDAEEVV